MDRLGRFLNFLGEVISLNSKYRAFVFLFVLIVLAIMPASYLEAMPNLSICSHVLGKYCYSVGITRGVSSLLKGNLELAWSYNWISIPVVVVMIGILVGDFFRKTN